MNQRKAFIDLETTGTHLEKDRIIEIAIVLTTGDVVEEEWSTLVDPEGVTLNPFISQLTGIVPPMYQHAPQFSELAETILEKLHDRVLYAHNARFDYAFLKQAFMRCNIIFSSSYVCTVRLSRLLYPQFQKHSLDAVRARFALPEESRHRALGDTRSLLHFLQHIYATEPREKIEKMLQLLTTKSVLPPQLKQKVIEKLPESPGVYIFRDQQKQVLYVGKSISIKKRVQSHFYNTTSDSKELALFQQVKTIESIETATEFEALVEESTLVKTLLPVYNRKLRKKQSFCRVMYKPDSNGYLQLWYDRNTSIGPTDVQTPMSLFPSIRHAKKAMSFMAEKHGLCQKYIGLEKTRSACFGYHLGQCQGACVKKESSAEHNSKLIEALQPYVLESWPFVAPIIVYSSLDTSRYHVINLWGYLASFASLQDAKDFIHVQKPVPKEFDMDHYKIINQYLRKPETNIITIENL